MKLTYGDSEFMYVYFFHVHNTYCNERFSKLSIFYFKYFYSYVVRYTILFLGHQRDI